MIWLLRNAKAGKHAEDYFQGAELRLCVTAKLQQLGFSFLLECEKYYITPASHSETSVHTMQREGGDNG